MRIPIATALAVALFTASALAQNQAQPPQSDGPLGAVGRWFSESFASIGSHFREAEQGVTKFRNEAGVAAKKTGTAVKDAADVVTKLPNTRVLAGHRNARFPPTARPIVTTPPTSFASGAASRQAKPSTSRPLTNARCA